MGKNRTILYTTNYNLFARVEVNRKINDSNSVRHIKGLTESMKQKGFRSTEPIIVSQKASKDVKITKDGKSYLLLPQGKHGIADGQHRYEAAMAAGVGIYYVIDDEIPMTGKGLFDAFLDYNEWKKVVRKSDYINGYATLGNEDFKILDEFGEKYPMFTLTERMMLLQNSGTKHPSSVQFKKGKFNIENVKKASQWADYLLELKDLFPKGYNKSNFVRAILTIAEKKKGFKFDEFIHKVKLRPGSIYLCGDKRSYSVMIENIYNYRRREDEKLTLRF